MTGGLGALGLSVATWMVGCGARHLVLAGRRGPSSEAAAEIAAMEQAGANVTVVRADVSRADDVRSLFRTVTDLPPLRGILHAAGVVDDGVLVQQSADRLAAVFAPKAAGAWHLHDQTRDVALDFFVLFSSMVSTFGGPGQGSYAAANGFLDGLAAHRRARGLSGLSIQWGPWAGAGMAGRVQERDRQRWLAQGFRAILPADAVASLDHLIRHDAPPVTAVLSVDWPVLRQQFPAGGVPPFLKDLASEFDGRSAVHEPQRRRLADEIAAVTPNRRRSVVVAFLRSEALKVLGLDAAAPIDGAEPLHNLGLDSLMAVELRNTIAAAVDRPMSATLLFKHPTLEALADVVMTLLGSSGHSVPEALRDRVAEELAPVSDEDARRLLSEELESLGAWVTDEA